MRLSRIPREFKPRERIRIRPPRGEDGNELEVWAERTESAPDLSYGAGQVAQGKRVVFRIRRPRGGVVTNSVIRDAAGGRYRMRGGPVAERARNAGRPPFLHLHCLGN